MSTITLRGGVEVENPLELALEFLAAYSSEADSSASPTSFDESDLRHANRGGARISAVTIAGFLELAEAAMLYPRIKTAWIEFLAERPDPVIDRVE